MNKKILIFLAILIVAVSAVSIVSAAETLKVNGVEFNIPDGYTYDDSLVEEANQGFNFPQESIGAFSNGNDKVMIVVIQDQNNQVQDEIDKNPDSQKTINGKTGLLIEDAGDGMQSFMYVDGGKAIAIKTTDASIIDKVIK